MNIPAGRDFTPDQQNGAQAAPALAVPDLLGDVQILSPEARGKGAALTLLADASREIRTPLNGLLGMAHALLSDARDSREEERLRTMLDAGEGLLTVLSDIIDLAQVEAERLEVRPEPVDLAARLESFEMIWTGRADAQGIRLAYHCHAALPDRAVLDWPLLQKCLTKMMGAALAHSTYGSVTVEVSGDVPGHLALRVSHSDPNPSAPSVDLPRYSASPAAPGNLGLTLAAQLARLMGGGLRVGRTEAGEAGPAEVALTVTVPAACVGPNDTFTPTEEGAPAESDIRPRTLPHRDLRALVVEDVHTNRMILRALLNDWCSLISEASDGAEALAALGSDNFDVVLMDLHMPGMDGATCTKLLRASSASWSTVPVIGLTADVTQEQIDLLKRAGMDAVLPKPFDPARLFATLNRVLTRAAE